MNQRKDRKVHFFVYLVAGAAMGGFLDVIAFGEPTPFGGMIMGAVVATLYQAAIWTMGRRQRS